MAEVQRHPAHSEGVNVYVWIWRKLPGGPRAKIAGCALLFLAAVALLFFVIFPYVEPRLPFNDVTITQ